jgi:hypothetical protein
MVPGRLPTAKSREPAFAARADFPAIVLLEEVILTLRHQQIIKLLPDLQVRVREALGDAVRKKARDSGGWWNGQSYGFFSLRGS